MLRMLSLKTRCLSRMQTQMLKPCITTLMLLRPMKNIDINPRNYYSALNGSQMINEEKKRRKETFLLKKKFEQGLKSKQAILGIERIKKVNLVSNQITGKFIIVHFENFGKNCYENMMKIFPSQYKKALTFFLGMPYTHLSISIDESKFLTSDFQVLLVEDYEVYYKFYYQNDEQKVLFLIPTNIESFEMSKYEENKILPITEKKNLNGLEIHDIQCDDTEIKELFKIIDGKIWSTLYKRRVQNYGYHFDYSDYKITKGLAIESIPSDLIQFIRDNILRGHHFNYDQLTITEFLPGSSIPWQIDSHDSFEEEILIISIGGSTIYDFKNLNGSICSIFMPRNSYFKLRDEARFAWMYSVSPRKYDKIDEEIIFRERRIELRFRIINKQSCKCSWKEYCDSQNEEASNVIKEHLSEKEYEEISIKNQSLGFPTDVEKKYVYETYGKIANHFDSTRYKSWPKITQFLKSLPTGSIVADIGCGNGKYFGTNEDLVFIGLDRSFKLVEICKNKNNSWQVCSGDAIKIPLRNESVDVALSIAVIHHLSTEELRKKAIQELSRITKPGGKILIYAWALEQEKKFFKHQDVLIPWYLDQSFNQNEVISYESSREKIDDSDIRNQDSSEKRYYHMFRKNEMENLVSNFKELTIENSYYDHANWCILLLKS